MEQKTIVDMHAEYHWELVDSKTGIVKQTVTCTNMILDSWIDELSGKNSCSSGRIYIAVGTGTALPAKTDTALSHSLGSTEITLTNSAFLADSVTELTFRGTFGETAVVGNLAEFGLARESFIRTRALITDSEGNPITIQKTDADILNVSIKLAVRLDSGSPGITLIRCQQLLGAIDADRSLAGIELAAHGNSPDEIVKPQTQAYAQHLDSGLLYRISRILGVRDSASTQLSFMVDSLPELSFTRAIYRDFLTYYGPRLAAVLDYVNDSSVSSWQGFLRWESRILASTDSNLPNGYSTLIKAIWLENYSLWISFPNSTLYPSKSMTFEFTGDGGSDEFSVNIPELETEGAVVSIDGVVQDPSTYAFSGKNFNLAQAWRSLDNRFVTHSGEYYANPGTSSSNQGYLGVPLTFPQSVMTIGRPDDSESVLFQNRTWDFKEPVTVNTFANTLIYNNHSGTPFPTAILEYSTDSINWIEAARLELSYNKLETKTFNPITARYWRLSGAPLAARQDHWYGMIASGKNGYTGVFCAFDNVQPWLKFNTAPAAGAVITVTAKCAYPMKNANWRVDSIVTDIAVERGE